MILLRLMTLLLMLQSANLSSAGEQKITVSNLRISLWPEYDNPQVLVMYKGSVSSGVELPAEFKLNILPGTANPHVASVTATGGHIHDPFEVKTDDSGTYVSFVLKERDFHLEFYFNPFRSGVSDRAFTYNYKTYYSVSNFSYEVQQPVGALDFKTTPASFQVFTDEKGIAHSQVTAGSLAAGEAIKVSVSYFKSNSETSLQKLEKSERGTNVYTLISTGVLILLVALMTYSYFGKSSKKRSKVQRAGAKRKTRAAHAEANKQPEKLIFRSDRVPNFCSNCGEKVDKDTKFCGSCGVKIQNK